MVSIAPARPLPEREGERLHAGVEELDLELAIDDRFGLSDQLMQARLADDAIAGGIHVETSRGSRRLAVNRHAETNRGPLQWRTHDEMQVAGMKAIRDPSAWVAKNGRLPAHRPIANERPLIERQTRRGSVAPPAIELAAAGRREVLGAVVADVVLRRLQALPIGRRFDAAALDRDGPFVG